MATLLHIQASPRRDRSYSLRAAIAFVEAYSDAHPDDSVKTLDLATTDLPAFDATAVSAKYRILHGEEYAREERESWTAVESCIDEFKSADKLVISSPMWNFGIPYRLKQYLDIIIQPSYTFTYSDTEGYRGLVTGKPAMLILARGGEYAPGSDAASYDMQKPYLELALGFMGFTQIDSILVEPTLMAGRDAALHKLDEAVALAREKAAAF